MQKLCRNDVVLRNVTTYDLRRCNHNLISVHVLWRLMTSLPRYNFTYVIKRALEAYNEGRTDRS